MSPKAKAINNLYKRGKITIEGVAQAVKDGTITPEEYEMITGVYYPVD